MDFGWNGLFGQAPVTTACLHITIIYNYSSAIKLDAQENSSFVLLIFSSFTVFCRLCMGFLDEKLTGSGPKISAHPGFTLSCFLTFCFYVFQDHLFCVWLFPFFNDPEAATGGVL